MADFSLKYYELRTTDEYRAASRATCIDRILAHRQMARRYAEKARKMREASGATRFRARAIPALRIPKR